MNELFGVNLTNILYWLGFGLVVGLVAHVIDPGAVKGGILGTIITGVLGAVLGGALAPILFGVSLTGFNITSIAIAVGGALLLVMLQRLLMRDTQHIRTTNKEI